MSPTDVVTIRSVEPSDALGIARVRVAAWRAAYSALVPSPVLEALDPVADAVRFEKWIRSGVVDGYVATHDGLVVGFVLLRPSRDDDASEDTGEVPLFYINPGWWRRRIGTDLWQRVRELASARGFQDLTLWVLEGNDRARRFYEQCGFELDGAAKTDTRLADTPLREVRYRRRLDLQVSLSHRI